MVFYSWKKLFSCIVVLCAVFYCSFAPAESPADAQSGKSFIYTLTNPTGPNAVDCYELDNASGRLTYQGSYPTRGRGQATDNIIAVQQSAIASDGRFLYVVNPGSNDLSIFFIKQDGSLRLVRHGISSGGAGPVSIALRGHLMYVANIGDDTTIPANYTGFRVDGASLEPIPGSTITLNVLDHPANVLFSQDGGLLVGSRGIAGIVDVFRVGADGRLTRTGELDGQPGVLGLAFNPARPTQFMGALTFLPGASSYLISAAGEISLINTVEDPPSLDSCWEVISRSGNKAWVSAPMSASVTLYEIGESGALTRISAHDTSPLGAGAADMTFDAGERYLYLLKSFGNRLHVMRLTDGLADAGVEDLQTLDIPGSIFSAIGLLRVDNPGR